MVLSRIWSYIILFSIAVGGYTYVNGDRNIFNDMVTGVKHSNEKEPNPVYYFMLPADSLMCMKQLSAFKKQLDQFNWQPTNNLLKSNYLVTSKVNEQTRALFNNHAVDLVKENNGSELSVSLNSKVHTDSLIKLYLAAINNRPIVEANDLHKYVPKNIDGIFETGKFAIALVIGLIGTLALFMGLLNIAEAAGGINLISRTISPFLSRLFPEIPQGHPSFGHMIMNFSANILGLDNAATPFGLKAMQSLQELNQDKDKATNSQIMFLALHASGLTLIPVSIIAVRAANGSLSPNEIFIPLMLTTFVCTMTAMLLCAVKQKINLLQPRLFFPLFIITALLGLFVFFLKSLAPYALDLFSNSFSNGSILLVFLVIVAGALYKKAPIFDAFVDGAKGGFETAVRIVPYMVGMLVAVSMLRTSGAFELIIDPLKNFIAWTGMDTQWAEGLPTALLRPFSAGGARGFMIDAMRMHGPDSFIGKLVCILQGSSETTFYVVALYFGSVSVKNTRYAIPVMLLADLAGIIFSVLFAYYIWQ